MAEKKAKSAAKARTSAWDTNLPDPDKWQPRHIGDKVSKAFANRCKFIGERIIARANEERTTNFDNFDSGSGVEDIVRQELKQVLPRRYQVTAATVVDRKGYTSGDCDVVITDDFWAPIVKAGATESSRKIHIPVEAIYGIIEVKQTLDLQVLDKAIEKLVVCRRLTRPRIPATQISENVDLGVAINNLSQQITISAPVTHQIPMFSATLAINLGKGTSVDDIKQRFIKLNKSLKRNEVIQVVCILQEFCLSWIWFSNIGPITPTFGPLDETRTLYPWMQRKSDERNPFFVFVTLLLNYLHHTILPVADIPFAYGPQSNVGDIFLDAKSQFRLYPDNGTVERSKAEAHLLREFSKAIATEKPDGGADN